MTLGTQKYGFEDRNLTMNSSKLGGNEALWGF